MRVEKQSRRFIGFILQRKTYVYKYIHYSQREISDNNRVSSWRPNIRIDTLADILERLIVNLHCEQTISSKKKKKKPIGSACYSA